MKKRGKDKKKHLVLYTFLILFILLILVSIQQAYKFTHPKRSTDFSNDRHPKYHQLPSEDIEFKSKDGITLRGWLINKDNSKGTIILIHGWNDTKEYLLNHSEYLYENNYSSLLFDLRAFGDSDGDFTSLGYFEKNDILGAIDYIKSREDVNQNIGALGQSMGAASLILAAKETTELNAIILDSSYATIHQVTGRRFKRTHNLPKYPLATLLTFFGGMLNNFNAFDLAPIKYINEINIPIFIIQGDSDKLVFLEESMKLYNKANQPKHIWITEGADHRESYIEHPKEYEEEVVNFFNIYLTKKE